MIRSGRRLQIQLGRLSMNNNWNSVKKSVRTLIVDSVWGSVDDSVMGSVWVSVCDSVWASVEIPVEDSVWASVVDSAREAADE